MQKHSLYIILCLLLVSAIRSTAQNNHAQDRIESILETITDEMGEEIHATLILDDLEQLINDKLNINTASGTELSKLHLLNSIQIEQLLRHREKYGLFYSVYDLNAIEGLNPEIIKKIEPFINFDSVEAQHKSLGEVFQFGKHEILLRTMSIFQKQAGFKAKPNGKIPFEGDKMRHYLRYKFSSGDDLSAGFTAEKDPGESFFKGSNRNGFDFHSAYLNTKISKVVQNIIIGDYVVKAGQGLVLWQGFAFSKSTNATAVSKTYQGIRPYTSVDENKFFRGAASSLKFNNTQIDFFISNKKIDANIAYNDSVGDHFTSFQSTGYHRTVTEIADKGAVKDLNVGAVFTWQRNNFRLGTVSVLRNLEIPYLPADQPYNKFNFRGKKNFVSGINYQYNKRKYYLFGEAAISLSSGKAIVQGAEIFLHDQIQVSALFRHFDKNYQSLWASPFSDSNSAINETGFYVGTKILPFKYVTLTAYTDYFHSPWIKYTTTAPSQGHEHYIQTNFAPAGNFMMYICFKKHDKDKKFIVAEKYVNQPERTNNIRLHCQYTPANWLILKGRLERLSYCGLVGEKGMLIFQDAQITPQKVPVNLNVRFAWFNTDSYNSRLYTYENDLLNVFSIPALFGKGCRYYLNLKYKINYRTELWLKWANLLQRNTESIGTGYNKIEGNNRTELKFQLRFKL